MAKQAELTKAFAYVRTSSASNVGPDKDSGQRQAVAVAGFAERAGFTIVQTFIDDAVSGTDDVSDRPGFSALLDAIEANGVRTVIVEDASRFARKLLTQEIGILALIARGVTLWASNGDELTNTDDEFKVAVRQIAGAFAQLEKARLVKKLKGARDRKRNPTDAAGKPLPKVKVEGRKSIAETKPEVVALARTLGRKTPKGGIPSLRAVAAGLAAAGHVTSKGQPYAAAAVAKMLAR